MKWTLTGNLSWTYHMSIPCVEDALDVINAETEVVAAFRRGGKTDDWVL